jgi:hypothetical protein
MGGGFIDHTTDNAQNEHHINAHFVHLPQGRPGGKAQAQPSHFAGVMTMP